MQPDDGVLKAETCVAAFYATKIQGVFDE